MEGNETIFFVKGQRLTAVIEPNVLFRITEFNDAQQHLKLRQAFEYGGLCAVV
jgi:hypothetical protein